MCTLCEHQDQVCNGFKKIVSGSVDKTSFGINCLKVAMLLGKVCHIGNTVKCRDNIVAVAAGGDQMGFVPWPTPSL